MGLSTATPAATTPTVVGQPPPLSAAAVQGRAAATIAATPIDAPRFGASSPPVVGNSFPIAEPAALPARAAPAASTPAPSGLSFAPRAPAPALDAELLGQRQLLLDQINAAQGVVSAGGSRDGYKMREVAQKSLETIKALSPLVNSTAGCSGTCTGRMLAARTS